MQDSETVSPIISVVIPTYNRENFVRDCVQSFIDQEFPKKEYEIIVCDDGSSDHTADTIRTLQASTSGPSIQYLLGSHKGSNSARNLGIRNAKAKLILFFDDDQLAPVDFLQSVIKAFEDYPDAGGIGGPYHDMGGSNLRTCKQCSLASVSLPESPDHRTSRLLGGNMTIQKELFHTVGMLDEEISLRGDESEWFSRASSHKFYYLPDLWVWHRRDHFTFWMLCRHSFRSGLSTPLYLKKISSTYKLRPVRFFRYIAHAVIRRCTKGIVMAFREIGAAVGYLKLIFHQV